MRGKSIVLIVIALGCGLVASIGAGQFIGKGGGAKVEMVKVFVAAANIDIGAKLVPGENVKLDEWPKSKVPEGALVDAAKIEGKYSLSRFYPDQIVLESAISETIPSKTATIPSGYRVISIKVNLEESHSGMMQPGDTVDVTGFFRKGGEIKATTMKTFLRNVRVWAVNSETERALDKEGKASAAKTISLLVTPKQGEKILLAKRLGEITLQLRGTKELTKEEAVLQQKEDQIGFSDILKDKAEDEAAQAETPGGEEGKSFQDWLSAQAKSVANTAAVPAAQPAVSLPVEAPKPHSGPQAGPQLEMVVITDQGLERYNFKDGNSLPSQVVPTETRGPRPPAPKREPPRAPPSAQP